MNKLRDTLEIIAADFSQQIIQALRTASIDDLSGIGGAGRHVKTNGAVSNNAGGRLRGRSAADIAHTLQRIVSLLQHHPEGLRAEHIRAELFLEKREMPKVITLGLSSGVLSKTGNLRATVYTVVSGHEPSVAVGKGTKKTGKRAARRKKTASGKRAAKKKARIRPKKMTAPEMERSILSFVKDAGLDGATEEEWMASVGLWPTDDVPDAWFQQARAVWSKLATDDTISTIGVRRKDALISFLPEDRPAPERVKELADKYEKKTA